MLKRCQLYGEPCAAGLLRLSSHSWLEFIPIECENWAIVSEFIYLAELQTVPCCSPTHPKGSTAFLGHQWVLYHVSCRPMAGSQVKSQTCAFPGDAKRVRYQNIRPYFP